MKNTYILTFDPLDNFDPDAFRVFLNAHPDILNWCAPTLPGAVIVMSHLNLKNMNTLLGEHMNGRRYIITEADAEKINGRMPKKVWEFIDNPKEIEPHKKNWGRQPDRNSLHAGLLPQLLRGAFMGKARVSG